MGASAATLIFPVVLRYLLPALVMLATFGPLILSDLANDVATGIAVIAAFTLVPVLHGVSQGAARADPRYRAVLSELDWYFRNWDIDRVNALASKDDRERMESSWAQILYFRTTALILAAYAVVLLAYGVWSIRQDPICLIDAQLTAAGTPAPAGAATFVHLLAEDTLVARCALMVTAPFILASIQVPVGLLAAVSIVVAWALYVEHVNLLSVLYQIELPNLARSVEAQHGLVAQRLCGLIVTVPSTTPTSGPPRSFLSYLIAGMSGPFTWPAVRRPVDWDTTSARIDVLLPSGAPMLTATSQIDRLGRYSISGVPFASAPYTVKIDPGTGHTSEWEQRYDEKRTDYLHCQPVDQADVLPPPPGTPLLTGGTIRRWRWRWWWRRVAIGWFVWLPAAACTVAVLTGLALVVGMLADSEQGPVGWFSRLAGAAMLLVIAGIWWGLGRQQATRYAQYVPVPAPPQPGLWAWTWRLGMTVLLVAAFVGLRLLVLDVSRPTVVGSTIYGPVERPDVRALTSDTDAWKRRALVLQARAVAVDQRDGGWGLLGPQQERTQVIFLGKAPGGSVTEWFAAAFFQKQPVLRGGCYLVTGIALGAVKRPESPTIAAARIPFVRGLQLDDVTLTAPRDCPSL